MSRSLSCMLLLHEFNSLNTARWWVSLLTPFKNENTGVLQGLISCPRSQSWTQTPGLGVWASGHIWHSWLAQTTVSICCVMNPTHQGKGAPAIRSHFASRRASRHLSNIQLGCCDVECKIQDISVSTTRIPWVRTQALFLSLLHSWGNCRFEWLDLSKVSQGIGGRHKIWT